MLVSDVSRDLLPRFFLQVKGLLALDPGNEQYRQLASDLADATRLTEQLIKAQSGGGSGSSKKEEAPPTGTDRRTRHVIF